MKAKRGAGASGRIGMTVTMTLSCAPLTRVTTERHRLIKTQPRHSTEYSSEDSKHRNVMSCYHSLIRFYEAQFSRVCDLDFYSVT